MSSYSILMPLHSLREESMQSKVKAAPGAWTGCPAEEANICPIIPEQDGGGGRARVRDTEI